jgi:hypothetical protein
MSNITDPPPAREGPTPTFLGVDEIAKNLDLQVSELERRIAAARAEKKVQAAIIHDALADLRRVVRLRNATKPRAAVAKPKPKTA